MYLLNAPDESVPAFRGQLNDLGDSVVVVGGGGLWNIHVHTDDIGAAIERGVEIGVPHRIRVTRLLEAESLREQGRGPIGERGLVAVAKGDGIAEYLEAQGVVVVRAPDRGRASTAELLAGIEACVQSDVIVLPGDKDTVPVAEAAAAAARDRGVRASVVPTRSIVQSLAAIAVHDDANRFDDDVIAMGRAAGATRYAGVTIAAKTSTTGAGTCQPGDVLGLVHGDIVEIGDDVVAVAERVVERIVSRGTELLTVVAGATATDEQIDALVASVAQSRPDIEVDVLPGGQAHWPLILGAE
jgi:dihydroxyacetone kinase-like predicted kinase